MILSSSNAFRIFLQQAWHTRSDGMSDVFFSPIFAQSWHLSCFETLKRFWVENYIRCFLEFAVFNLQWTTAQSTIIIDTCCCPLKIGKLSSLGSLFLPSKHQHDLFWFPATLSRKTFETDKFHITIWPLIGWVNWIHKSCQQAIEKVIMWW